MNIMLVAVAAARMKSGFEGHRRASDIRRQFLVRRRRSAIGAIIGISLASA
jgi:hypothetical protein